MKNVLIAMLLTVGAAWGQRPAVAMMPNSFASDPQTTDNYLMRFDQTVAVGSNYLVGNATWEELEPERGVYNLDGLRYLAYVAAQKNLRVSFTLRLIDGARRATPAYLNGRRWNSPAMIKALRSLLDAISQTLGSRAEWYVMGYEINSYFQQNPTEVDAFTALYRDAKSYLKSRQPGAGVSSAVIFYNLGDFDNLLAPLLPELDFLALTYIPMRSGWTVWGPSVVAADFQNMRQRAGKRQILLLEIAYPSSPQAGSSTDAQALFYRNVFAELQHTPASFAAAAFMLFGDLSDSATQNWAYAYGISDPQFVALFQTLGVFDKYGQAKPAWQAFKDGVAALR